MSLPPLPDIFGNYVLGDFVEVTAPSDISWLPQTAGWYWVGAAALIFSLRYGWQRLRHWYRNRYRREATARLENLAQSSEQVNFLVELNQLLKLTALAAFSRERVARLHGRAWVNFLNQQCVAAPFSEDLGQLLAVGAYSNAAIEEDTRQHLLAACRHWVVEHQSPEYV
jgi:hypothetical protein